MSLSISEKHLQVILIGLISFIWVDHTTDENKKEEKEDKRWEQQMLLNAEQQNRAAQSALLINTISKDVQNINKEQAAATKEVKVVNERLSSLQKSSVRNGKRIDYICKAFKLYENWPTHSCKKADMFSVSEQ